MHTDGADECLAGAATAASPSNALPSDCPSDLLAFLFLSRLLSPLHLAGISSCFDVSPEEEEEEMVARGVPMNSESAFGLLAYNPCYVCLLTRFLTTTTLDFQVWQRRDEQPRRRRRYHGSSVRL